MLIHDNIVTLANSESNPVHSDGNYRQTVMGVRYLLHYFVAGVMALAMSLPVQAQQPISGNYAAGAFTGMKGMLTLPPKSVVLENDTLFYNTQDFVDSDGNTLPTDTVNALANRTIIGYVTEVKILGGDYFPAVIVPFANVALRYYFEFGARNTSEGIFTVLSLAYVFPSTP